MIRNITLNNRTLLLGGGVREQIDSVLWVSVETRFTVVHRFVTRLTSESTRK